MKTIGQLLQLVVFLIIIPFVLLYRLIIILLVTSWLWAIPVAILIWALKR